jgi:LPXTG-site transpeptidase (sortase) family protein
MTLLEGPTLPPSDLVERRVWEMDAVRQMAARIAASQDGRDPVALTDEEWRALCANARGAATDNLAVTRVVRAADALGRSATTAARSEVPDEEAPPIPEPLLRPGTADLAIDQAVPVDAPGVAVSAGSIDLPIPSSFGAPASEGALAEPPTVESPIGADPGTAGSDEVVSTATDRRSVQRRLRRRTSWLSFPSLDDRRRERWLTIASWVRNIGLIILLFVAWQLWGTGITQHQSQEALKKQFQAKVAHVVTKPSPTFTLTPATTRIADPPDGQVMAKLQIPAIGVSQFVVSGTDQGDLAKGPGHYLGTAMPGQAGNVAIAGHRTTHGAPFNRLAQLSVGDPIYLTTLSGQQLTYIVSAPPVAVSPSDVTVLNNFGDNRLTLTTCNPEYSAVQRLIVVAAYLPPGTSKPQPIAKTPGKPYVLASSVANGWNLSQLPLALLCGGLLALLGLFFRRLSRSYGQNVRWLILVPIWLALLLALFESLANVLPASV